MLLLFSNGEAFATGVQPYLFRPVRESDSSKRVIIEVEIEGQRTHAMVDTGAPYVICEPNLAEQIGVDPEAALLKTTLEIQGLRIDGALHKLNLTLRAEQGEQVTINATTFIPNKDSGWVVGLPSVVGLEGCLEWVRTALDPASQNFYFGTLD